MSCPFGFTSNGGEDPLAASDSSENDSEAEKQKAAEAKKKARKDRKKAKGVQFTEGDEAAATVSSSSQLVAALLATIASTRISFCQCQCSGRMPRSPPGGLPYVGNAAVTAHMWFSHERKPGASSCIRMGPCFKANFSECIFNCRVRILTTKRTQCVGSTRTRWACGMLW